MVYIQIFYLNKLQFALIVYLYFQIRIETNLILIGLAFSDMLTILTNIPYVVHFYLIHGQKSLHAPFIERDSKFWTYLLKIHTSSSITFHTVSIWLTVYLAIFRYCYIKTSMPLNLNSKNTQESTNASFKHRLSSLVENGLQKLCSFKCTMIMILSIYISGFIICSPAYFYSNVNEGLNENGLIYYFIDESDLNIRTNESNESFHVR